MVEFNNWLKTRVNTTELIQDIPRNEDSCSRTTMNQSVKGSFHSWIYSCISTIERNRIHRNSRFVHGTVRRVSPSQELSRLVCNFQFQEPLNNNETNTNTTFLTTYLTAFNTIGSSSGILLLKQFFSISFLMSLVCDIRQLKPMTPPDRVRFLPLYEVNITWRY